MNFGIAHHHKFICIEYQYFRDINALKYLTTGHATD